MRTLDVLLFESLPQDVPDSATQPAEMERSAAHPAEMQKSVAQPAEMEKDAAQPAEMEKSAAQPAEMKKSTAQTPEMEKVLRNLPRSRLPQLCAAAIRFCTPQHSSLRHRVKKTMVRRCSSAVYNGRPGVYNDLLAEKAIAKADAAKRIPVLADVTLLRCVRAMPPERSAEQPAFPPHLCLCLTQLSMSDNSGDVSGLQSPPRNAAKLSGVLSL